MNTTELSTASPRATFEEWLRRHPDALHWNPTDAMFSAWCGALASPAPGRAPLSLEQQKSESVLVNSAARKLYNAYTDNHPTIHCNRFPSWEELDAKERKEWIKKVGIAPAGGIGGE